MDIEDEIGSALNNAEQLADFIADCNGDRVCDTGIQAKANALVDELSKILSFMKHGEPETCGTCGNELSDGECHSCILDNDAILGR